MLRILSHYSRTDKLILASGAIGNFLENFDVMICAFFANSLATTFFPENSPTTNLFYTFNIFLLGYIFRPLGSLLIGLYADQIGRKRMLIFSIFMTGLSTVLIGLIPSYQAIGLSSTLIFLFLRILQNVFVGGEYISSISYLIENAKQEKRGFFGSWVSLGFNSGALIASLLAFIFIFLIAKGYFPPWSWRVVFLLAFISMIVGIWIRFSLPESLGFSLETANDKKQNKFGILKAAIKLIQAHPYLCLAVVAIGWLGVSETAAIFVYFPVYMNSVNHFSQYQVHGINFLSLLLLVFLIPVFGNISDYFSRPKILLITSLSFLVLTPIYFCCLSYGSYLQVLIIKLLFSIPSACFYAIGPVLIAESFPTHLRCTSLALVYQSTGSLAAGLAPLILLSFSKGEFAYQLPTYFLGISSILGICGLFLLINKALTMQAISLPDPYPHL